MKTLLLSLFMAHAAWGQVTSAQIQNFDFKYSAPLGQGSAELFNYQMQKNPSQSVEVEKINGAFKVVLQGVENQEFILEGAPSLMTDAESINLDNFNLLFTDRVSLSMSSGNFKSTEEDLRFKGFSLNCNRAPAGGELMDGLIQGCLQKLSLKTSSFNSNNLALTQGLMKVVNERQAGLSSVGVKNLDLKIANGKLELSAEVSAQISGTAKGKGSVSYDASVKKLTIKISEVKFGFLDVTSQVFDQLENEESESMKVNKPYVYLTIK